MTYLPQGVIAAAAAAVLLAPGCDSVGSGMEDDGYEVFASMDWELSRGEEKYYCIRKTIDEDMYFSGFEALAPPGTHHTVMTVGSVSGPDGLRECTSYDHQFDGFMFESSSDAGRFELLPGLAARVKAGQQVNINIHVLNATDATLSGTTGTRVKRVEPTEDFELATSVYMGKLTLEIPPGESTHMGDCQVSDDVTLFGVLPHMHTFGSHMKVVAKSSVMGDQVILDEDFYFDSNKELFPIEEVPMKLGDKIEVYCSYENTTGDILRWGQDGYTAEMCFAGVYLYPADKQSSACAR
jgi:hypothetical protein